MLVTKPSNLKLIIIMIIVMVFTSIPMFLKAQSTTTFAKTYNLDNVETLSHSLKGRVEVVETKSNRIIIECII